VILMTGTDRVAEFKTAQRDFQGAVQGMERFLMNLDPTRGQTLRDWLRSVSVDARSGRSSAPEMEGWPLAEQIGGHLEIVMEARTGLQKAWRHLNSSEKTLHVLPSGLR
jgi:hypothetical protein